MNENKENDNKELEPNSLDKLVTLLRENPALADKMLESITKPEKQDSLTSEETKKALDDILSGKSIELDKGPIVGEVWQGLSVCGICGKEQKTYTNNPNGIVTQHICIYCRSQMTLMKTDAERFDYFQNGLANDYLASAKAKFKVMLQRFESGRRKQAEKLKNRTNDDGPNPFNFTATGKPK